MKKLIIVILLTLLASVSQAQKPVQYVFDETHRTYTFSNRSDHLYLEIYFTENLVSDTWTLKDVFKFGAITYSTVASCKRFDTYTDVQTITLTATVDLKVLVLDPGVNNLTITLTNGSTVVGTRTVTVQQRTGER